MIRTALAAMVMLVLGAGADQRGRAPSPPAPAPPAFRGSVTVHEEVILRLPRASRARSLPFPDTVARWREARA